MKNSKKCDFKKLALLGITGGAMLGTQAVEAEAFNPSELLAANGCGAMQTNQSMGSNEGYQAYRNMPSQDAYYYNNNQGYASCGGAAPQYYQSGYDSGMQYYQSAPQNYQSAPQYYQPSGYPTTYPQNYQTNPNYSTATPNQTWTGCGAASHQTYQAQANSQPSSGCGSASPAQGQTTNQPMTAATPAAQQTNWSQWETADNTKPAQNRATIQRESVTIQQDNGTTIQQDKRTIQKQLTESELLSQLNEEGKKTYNSLDATGKALALKMASQDTFKDKNLAVKAAALKMSEKRAAPASSKY